MPDQSPLSRTCWYQDGAPRAWCPGCGWRTRHDVIATVNRHVNAHVRETGHRVQMYRTQWKSVQPSPE